MDHSLNRSNIPDIGWWLLMGFIFLCDAIQVVFSAFIFVNRFFDIFVGAGIWLVLTLGEYKFDTNDYIVLFASFFAEEIPLVDIAPFWTIDVWRFYSKDKARQ